MSSTLRASTFLEDYLESASGVPGEVVRNLVLMRELDGQAQTVMQRSSERRAAALPVGSDAAEEAKMALRSDLRECQALSAEKVAIARQTYDLLDRHIRRLDADLRNFESELDGTAGDTAEVASAFAEESGSSSSRSSSSSSSSGRHKKKKKTKKTKHHQHDHHTRRSSKGGSHRKSGSSIGLPVGRTPVLPDMPVDPDEPVYCVCQQASWGKMIECENPDCTIEWFHYPCVGLSSSPKGHWFCPECRVLMRKQQQQAVAAAVASLPPPDEQK